MTTKETLAAYEKKLHEMKMLRVYFLRELNTFNRFEDRKTSPGWDATENAHDMIDFVCMKLDETIDALDTLVEKVMDMVHEEEAAR